MNSTSRNWSGGSTTSSGTACPGKATTGWWGEGEIKSYLDGDEEWPTIGGTGTEDCFFGSYNFDRD